MGSSPETQSSGSLRVLSVLAVFGLLMIEKRKGSSIVPRGDKEACASRHSRVRYQAMPSALRNRSRSAVCNFCRPSNWASSIRRCFDRVHRP